MGSKVKFSILTFAIIGDSAFSLFLLKGTQSNNCINISEGILDRYDGLFLLPSLVVDES